jgi:MATE family multidrug resistance protein
MVMQRSSGAPPDSFTGSMRERGSSREDTVAMTLPGPRRRVWRLAGPIILSNLSVPLLGAVDTAVVGHLPDPAYVGAVAVGAMIFNFLYWGFGFLRMGTTGFAAQAYGSGDTSELASVLARALLLALSLGLALWGLQLPIRHVALGVIEASPQVASLAGQFFQVRIWSAPATLANYALLGWLLGVQRPRTALALQVFMNGLNILLNLLFVLGFHWGVRGVAGATVLAEYAAAGLGLLLVARALPRPLRLERRRVLDRGRLMALLRVNRDIFIRTLCLVLAFAYFTARGAAMGDVLLAANAVLLNFQSLMAYALDGFAHAAEILVGSAVGARDRAAFSAAVRTATGSAAGLAVGFALIYGVAGDLLIGLFTDLPAVRQAAHDFLPWMVLSPLVSVWSFQLDGVFIGATRTVEMRNGMIIALACYLAAALLLVPLLGNHGLWLALMLLMVARAVPLALWYPRILRSLG